MVQDLFNHRLLNCGITSPDKIKTSKTTDQFKAALKTHYFMLNN